MKKKIFYAFVGLLLLLILLYLVRYKTSDNFQNRIPENATAIIKINLRQLEQHFLVDAIKNPLSYLKTSKKDSLTITTKKKKPSLLKAIKIPKNIFFYTTKTKFDEIWKSEIIKIKDLNELKKLLTYHNFKVKKLNNGLIYDKKSLKFIIKNEELILVINSNDIITKLDLEFNHTNYLSENTSLYKKLISIKGDIAYITDKENITLNFNTGKITGNGIANFNLFLNTKTTIFENSIGSISTTIDKKSPLFNKYYRKLNKEKFRNMTKLNIDSIISKWNGNLQFNLFNVTVKSDTIKTYEYDDNFNKIEKVAIQKNSLPEFKTSINDSNKKLYNYLVNQKAIQFVENDSIFITFPLIKVLTNHKDGKLNFKSVIKKNTVKKTIENKLNLLIDFASYHKKTKKTPFSYANKIKNLKNCDIRISNNDEIYINIEMADANRNALTQLFNFN